MPRRPSSPPPVPRRDDFELVARLVSGQSVVLERAFRAGTPVRPITVGSRGAWRVLAPHVAPVHLTLAFNGEALYVSSRAPVPALLERAPIAGWTEVRPTSELRFGAARLVVSRRRARMFVTSPESATRVLTPSSFEALQAACLEQSQVTTVERPFPVVDSPRS